MSDAVIQVNNLSKKYIIGKQQRRHNTLRDVLANGAKSLGSPFRKRNKSLKVSQDDEFWALNGLSFEIKQGDRVGIIGRNGAGKSTLLKILSRITEPTTGSIEIQGRVASLLEVGTGFHPELTGRENIFLNGAILGMGRIEIQRKFDEIVAFAEVEKFLDTPVKRYSSGMYVRLAFAVAAHLEPEILIVDEVLAVGDAQFQKKCLGKMEDVATKEGRTILFVSHQMAAINNLCKSCIFMQSGRLDFYGSTESAMTRYLEAGSSANQDGGTLSNFRPSWASPFITSAKILNAQGQEQNDFPLGSNICFEMTFDTQDATRLTAPVMGIVIKHAFFGIVTGVNTRMTGLKTESSAGYTTATMRCIVERMPLLQGNYTVDVWLGNDSKDVDTLTEYLSFHIEGTDIYGSGHPPFSHMGTLFLEPKWQIIAS